MFNKNTNSEIKEIKIYENLKVNKPFKIANAFNKHYTSVGKRLSITKR